MERKFFEPKGQQPEEVFDIDSPEAKGEIMNIGEGFKNKLIDMIEKKGIMRKMGCDREILMELINMFSPEDIESLAREIQNQKEK